MVIMLVLMSIFSLHQLPANQEALCSWYGPGFHGKPTACGEVFDMNLYSAAHKTLPMGTIVEFESDRGRVRVIINDRGPYIGDREFDLSRAAFKKIAPLTAGVLTFKYVIIGRQ